ncbi:hypothetical protein [Haloarcula marina]|uniref:hypothetical protein n=1 Tax=Haloarcula marina TaxID=2961574 RepID=UPI0020B89B15|nr:hypothetical protein [Halomicroarcula marina]
MSCGVVYVATGEEFLDDAMVSAGTVRETNSSLSIGVITAESLVDAAEAAPEFDDIVVATAEFDDIRDKHANLHLTPYDRTLYLDTDTFVLDDLKPIFEVLDWFDIAVTHAPFRSVVSIDGVSPAFPEVNGGVIAYRQSEAVASLFERWQACFDRQRQEGRPDETIRFSDAKTLDEIPFGRLHDQPPLREALYHSDIRFTVMPPEYNFRGPAAYAESAVTVMHMGHSTKASALAAVVNDRTEPRVYIDWQRRLYFQSGDNRAVGLPRLEAYLGHPAVVGTLKKIGVYESVRGLYRRLIGRTDGL